MKAKRKAKPQPRKIKCEWFLLCDRPAVGYTPHSILGLVPTCARCHKFATDQEQHPAELMI